MAETTDLFKINELGLLEINKIEVRNTPEFKTILTRSKPIEGDSDGRKKAFAFKEFFYIYLVTSPKSKFRDLPDVLRKEKAKHTSKLPEDWKEDEIIKKAIQKYKEDLKLSPTAHAYYNACKSVYSIGDDLKYFNKRKTSLSTRIEILSKELESLDILEEDKQKKELELNNAINSLMKLTEHILTINSKLEGAFDTLEKLYEKLAKDKDKGAAVRGGGDIGRRED